MILWFRECTWIRFVTWTEYDLLVSGSYFWFAQIKQYKTPSPPSWMIESLKIINWVWSTWFEILLPIRSNKTWIRIMISNPDSDSGKSNAPLFTISGVDDPLEVIIFVCACIVYVSFGQTIQPAHTTKIIRRNFKLLWDDPTDTYGWFRESF